MQDDSGCKHALSISVFLTYVHTFAGDIAVEWQTLCAGNQAGHRIPG